MVKFHEESSNIKENKKYFPHNNRQCFHTQMFGTFYFACSLEPSSLDEDIKKRKIAIHPSEQKTTINNGPGKNSYSLQ